MSWLAKLQLIGPVILLVAIAGAEGAGLALSYAPGSEALWYIHLNLFGAVRLGDEILGAYVDMAHGAFYLIGLPLFLLACGGFYYKRPLALAIASNLSFVYASLLVCAGYTHAPVRMASLASIPDVFAPHVYLHAGLLGGALLSLAASHIVYIRAIRQEHG